MDLTQNLDIHNIYSRYVMERFYGLPKHQNIPAMESIADVQE